MTLWIRNTAHTRFSTQSAQRAICEDSADAWQYYKIAAVNTIQWVEAEKNSNWNPKPISTNAVAKN